MLVYEIYLRNKDNSNRIVETRFPIKKLFYNNGIVKLDENSFDYYGSGVEKEFSELQTLLLAPLNDSNAERINLPDKSRGGNSYPNFVKLQGELTIEKRNNVKNNMKFTLKTTQPLEKFKLEPFSAVLTSNNTRNFKANGKLPLKIKMDDYVIGEQLLLDVYKDSKILDENFMLESETFKQICNTVFDYFYKNSSNFIPERNVKLPFEIYILPDENYIKINKINKEEPFLDSFGNNGTQFSNQTTRTVSFFSCDDPAFTINLADKYHRYLFYENLGISEESLEKIEFKRSDVFEISGLSWIFFNIQKNDYQFKISSGGIFNRLYENYHLLKKDSGSLKELVQMKIICYKKRSKKIEVLIDENMTMERMIELFENNAIKNIPESSLKLLFEVLIEENKERLRDSFFAQYINVVRTLITGNTLDKHQLVHYLTSLVKKRIHKEKWLKENIDIGIDFFNRSWICMKILFRRDLKNNFMDKSEEFAYNIGLIAGKYVKFREQEDRKDQVPKSLRDILTYTKYDIDKLKFVYSKVCLGVNLSNQEKNKIQHIRDYIGSFSLSLNNLENTVDNFRDLSYFFFKGVFANLGGLKQ